MGLTTNNTKISLPAPHGSFIPPKNPILRLKKIRFAETEIFLIQISGKFWFLETKFRFQGKKKIRFIEIKFFMKGKKKNSEGDKETWGLEEKSLNNTPALKSMDLAMNCAPCFRLGQGPCSPM
jgi:hypothetical protein